MIKSQQWEISLYDYQDELLRGVRKGKNSVIVLPTGTGKTFIVLKYTQEVLSKADAKSVVFMAPKVKLAEQQYRRFQFFFPRMTYFRVGRSRNANCDAPFAELQHLYRVFVMTPQCLVEAVKRKEVSITDFSLLVLDECHHAMGGHSYKVLLDLYMDAKFSQGTSTASLPQIVGLTASPGVGRGGTLDIAMDHLKQLCYNMDVEAICTVKENEAQLTSVVNEPTHEIRSCPKRKNDKFKRIIEGIMAAVEGELVKSSYAANAFVKETRDVVDAILKAPENHRGTTRYTEWATNVSGRLAQIDTYNQEAYTAAFSITEMLLRYQQALILNEDCESQYGLDYLLEEARLMNEKGTGVEETERKLLEHFKAHLPDLQRACADTEDHNPKLRMLEDILLLIWDNNQDDTACMVFVRTLELSKAIQKWMQVHPDLKRLNPGRVTGSRTTRRRKGMTKSEVEDVLTNFNAGKHKVVVCTSAAEEGLDFQSCNIVIRYDYVTHMISMVQTRGRARKKDSRYCVLVNELKGNLDKENENVACERLMKQAVVKTGKLIPKKLKWADGMFCVDSITEDELEDRE
nr:hypothetical protein BaRGS_033077 [Batillaria attramentaria]